MMQTKILISFTAFLLLFSSVVFAQQHSVDVSVSPENVAASPCGIATYDITVRNTGASDNFAVSVDGIPANWYTLTHTSVQLNKDESKTIYLFATVDCFATEKIYEGSITVKGRSQDIAKFILTVVPDHIIDVELPEEVSICLGDESSLTATVTNKGLFDEEIDLSLSGTAAEFVTLETTSLSLKRGESKTVNLTVGKALETVPGKYSLKLDAKSRSSYARDSDSSVISRTRCYDFTVTVEREIRTCALEEREFSFLVKNTGTKRDEFEVSVPSFNFTEKVALSPNESSTFNLTFLTSEIGTYEVAYTVKSSVITKEGVITFIAEQCYGVDLQVESNELTIEAGKGKLLTAKVVNTGVKKDDYQLTSDVNWVSLRPRNVTLVGNESADAFAYYSPEFGARGEFDTTLTVKSDRSQDEEKIKINVVEKEVTTTTIPPVTTTTVKVEVTEPIVVTPGIPNVTLPENVTTTVPTETTLIVTPAPLPNRTTTTTVAPPLGEVIRPLLGNIRQNVLLLSIIAGALIALAVFAVLYFVVMRE